MSNTHEYPVPPTPEALDIAMAHGRRLRSEAYQSLVQSLFAGIAHLVRPIRVNAGKHSDATPTFGNVA